jgi:hypothetical protein
MPYSKRIATAVVLAASLCGAASASAGVVDYPSTATFSVPNATDNGGLPSQVFVPPGRTAVEKVELVGVKPSYPAGGAADFELFLKSPQGPNQVMFTSACAAMANTSSFTVSDSATIAASTIGFCSNPNGVGKPNDPLSAFNGQPSAGVWTAGVRDIGLVATPNGSWNGWTLRLTHAAPTVTGTGTKQTLGKTQFLSVTADADGKVTVGGSAVTGPAVNVSANSAATIPFTVTKKVKKKVKKKGKATANVTVTLNDETNGTATATVPVKLTAPK